MNTLRRAAFLAVGAALVAQVAGAAGTDLVLGFTGNSASSDAVVDLGSASSIGVGGSAVVDLVDSRGSSFSETGLSGANFNSLISSVFGSVSGANGAGMTVAGGQNGISTFFYMTENRGAAGSDPTSPLSANPFAWSKSQQQSVGGFPAGVLNGAGITGAGGNAAVALSPGGSLNTSSFSYLILGLNNPGNSVQTLQGNLPSATISGGKAYEDVWFDNVSGLGLSGWQYKGYLTLDLTGDTTDLLTFTPSTVAVPEPSAYGLFAGLGLLLVAIRNRVNRKSA